MYLACTLLAMFSSASWMFRLSEFLSGLGAGLSLPLIHLYSAEVFTGQRYPPSTHLQISCLIILCFRRFKLALVIYLLEATGELLSTFLVTMFSVQVIISH